MLYRMSNRRFEQIDRSSFGKEGVLERQDLQRLLRDQPDVVEPGLFVVAEEFSNWTSSWRSIDLLGIGEDRRLVVVELKRGNTGETMELQAIRYAAMAANMTLDQVVEAHERYLSDRSIDENAQDRIHAHLVEEGGVEEPQVATERPRILLVSEDFSKELTTSVLWLNEVGLDIRCVRLRVYRYEGKLLIDVDQVIALPEAQDYLVRVRERAAESEERRAASGRHVPGSGDFEASIDEAPEEHQSGLKRLLQMAQSIEGGGHAQLSTYHGKGGGLSLLVRLQPENVGLVTVYNDGAPYLQFWRSVFQRRAKRSIPPLNDALKPKSLSQGSWIQIKGDIDDGILDLVKKAYAEANSPNASEQQSDS